MPPVGIEPRTPRLGAICFITTPPRLNVELVFQTGMDIKHDVSKLGSVCEQVVKLVRSTIPLGRNRVTIKGL